MIGKIIRLETAPVTMPAIANPSPVSCPWLRLILPSAIAPRMMAGRPVTIEQKNETIPSTKLVIAMPLVCGAERDKGGMFPGSPTIEDLQSVGEDRQPSNPAAVATKVRCIAGHVKQGCYA